MEEEEEEEQEEQEEQEEKDPIFSGECVPERVVGVWVEFRIMENSPAGKLP